MPRPIFGSPNLKRITELQRELKRTKKADSKQRIEREIERLKKELMETE